MSLLFTLFLGLSTLFTFPADQSYYSSVAISVEGKGWTSFGTGTVIATEFNKSLLITNAHVVEDDLNPIFVTYLYDNEYYKQECIYIAGTKIVHLSNDLIETKGPDLAILSVNCRLKPVKLSKDLPKVNSYVKIYGFGGKTTEPVLKEGKVIPIGDWLGDYTRTTLESVQGDSGSGVFNRNNELVAVLWGGASVRLDVVKEFLITELTKSKKFGRFVKELEDE